MKSWIEFFQKYRWTMHIAGLLVMSIVAQAVIVYYATRPDAPRPLPDYYQKSLEWDRDQAVEAASAQLGWKTRVDIASGPEVVVGMARAVDVRVEDRDGKPVTGLAGDLYAIRPADGRLNVRGHLVELPQEPGHYRVLLLLDAPGLWELGIDAKKDSAHYLFHQRVMVEQGHS